MNNVSSSNSQKALVPELRFPEFSDGWESTKFADLFEILSNNTLSRADLSDSGTVKNIHYGDVLIKFGDVVSAKDNTIPFIKDKTQLSKNTDYLKNGDIIITDTAEDDTVGKATEIQNISNESVVSGLHTIPCRAKERFAGGFLGYYLNSSAYHSQLYPLMQGIKVTSISKGNISKTELKFPSVNEQGKIACMLSLIDKKIEAQKQMIDSLKLYKRGLLKQIFDSKHEWQEVLLGNIADIYQPQTISSDMLNPTAQYAVYGANGQIGYYDKYNHETEQIAICCRGASCGTVNYIPAMSWITGNAMVINTDKYDVNKRFLFHQLSNSDLTYMISGSGQPQIVRTPCELHKVYIPNKELQLKISSFLDLFDKKTEKLEKNLLLLQQTKSALLQKMFI